MPAALSIGGAIVLTLHATPATAQGPFRALDARDSVSYRFDLQRNFYGDDAAGREHTALIADLDRLRRTAGRAPTTAAGLVRLLRLEDRVNERFVRYQAYLSLRTLTNTADTAAARLLDDISRRAGASLGAVGQSVTALDSGVLARWLREEPALRPFEFSMRQSILNARRARAASNPRVQSLNRRAATWGPELFRTTLRDIDFGEIRDSSGRGYSVAREPNAIRNHRERAVREAGFRANIRGMASREDTFALILSNTATMLNESARLAGSRDFAELSYGERFLTTDGVRALLRAVAATSDTNRRYERLRAARVAAELGLREVHTWDLTAPRGADVPRFTIGEARQAILAAVTPLGPSYAHEMSALLDPRNGRMDLIPRANRVERPGFSTGMVGFPSMFFQGRFEGYIEDVVILAHEAGHAVQNMLMDSAGVLPRYARGPSYMTESFGLFSELLVLSHLAHASTGERRIFFLERLLDQATDLYRNSWESAFEQAVFDSAAAGRKLHATALESMAQEIGSRYSSWHGAGSERRYAWVNPIQLYTWPLYRVNYVYGKLLALAYHDALVTDARKFRRAYHALLSGGYDAPPDLLLSRSLGLELTPDALVDAAHRVIQSWIGELETEYAARIPDPGEGSRSN